MSGGRRSGREGSALVLALAVLLIAHALAAAVAVRVVAGTQGTARRIESAGAFEAAEAGLADGVERLRRGESAWVPRRPVGAEGATVALEERTVSSLPLERTVELVATGRHRRATERLVLTVRVTTRPGGEGVARIDRLGWRHLPSQRR